MFRLPITGVRAQWRASTGHDDIALADSGSGLAAALDCVNRCVIDAEGSPLDAAALPVGDLDALVVARRSEILGDSLVAEGSCARCAAPVDVRFSLTAYAAHNRVRVPRGVTRTEDGWWELPRHLIRVRVPSVGDVLAASAASDPRGELIARCLSAGSLGARCSSGTPTRAAVRAAERALESLGPTLRADVTGTCPECGAEVVLDVDARELCLSELRFLAGVVYDDVNLIATAYHWTQDAILDMPSLRRRRYADLISGNIGGSFGGPAAGSASDFAALEVPVG